MSDESGRNSGGDLYDMAKDGTTVPADSAKPRTIPSVARPDQVASASDPNYMGATNLADAADNAEDIPRNTADVANTEAVTGTGDALPPQIDSKRLHNVPGGVTHDDNAKGSTRYTQHIAQDSEFDKGNSSYAEPAPGQESMSAEKVTDQFEKKE